MIPLKNTAFLGIFFLLFLAHFGFAQSYTLETVPNPKNRGNSYVSDPTNILSGGDVSKINRIIGEIEKVSGAQVAIVMLPSIGEENPKEFSTALFNKWGIGQKNSDNGLMILTVMDQRRTEFETGLGTEAVIPDAICYKIGMQELVPHYKLGNYGAGVVAALVKVQEILQNPEVVAEFQHNEKIYADPEGFSPLYWYILAALIFHLGLIIWILLTLFNKEDLYDKYMSIRPTRGWWFMIPFPIPYILAYFLIGRLLKKLRNHERFSKINGNPMRKLTEEEEDDFLEQGHIVEEEIGAVDYDVWVDENGDDVLILRYAKWFSKYKNCIKCNFKTYFLAHTLVIENATYSRSGIAEIIHECKNCGYQKIVEKTIPRKQRGGSGGGSGGGGGGGGSWGGGSSGGGGGGVSW